MEKIVLVGCDPEVFIRSITNKRPTTIIGKLDADKWHTRPISDVGHGVLEDNCTAEFNIPPSRSAEEFVEHIHFCMDWINNEMKQHGAEIFNAASVHFEDEDLSDPRAWVFGCEPDFNAYTAEQNPQPHCPDENLRSAGGHVHIGWKDKPKAEEGYRVIRAADIFLGVPSVLLDNDDKRRQLYGKAGACRLKPYGAEYRTLSNFWVFDDKLIKWVYNQVQTLTNYALTHAVAASDACASQVQNIINNNDKKGAEEIISRFGIVMP